MRRINIETCITKEFLERTYSTDTKLFANDDFEDKYHTYYEHIITEIEEDAFRNFINLEEIRLRYVRLKSSILPETLLNGLSRLRSFMLPDSSIRILSPRMFIDNKMLKDVCISANKSLRCLPQGLFDPCCDNLELLTLMENSLDTLPDDIFYKCRKLRSIHLNANNLTTISENLFQSQENLTTLDLSGNQITSISGKSFRNLRNLRHLNLSNNRLTSIPDDLLDGLPNLVSLNLNLNQLSSIPEGLYHKLPNLEITSYRDPRYFLKEFRLYG